jgi:hypothetical protein
MSVSNPTALGNQIAVYKSSHLLPIRLLTSMGANVTLQLYEEGIVQETKEGYKAYTWSDLAYYRYAGELINGVASRAKLFIMTKSGEEFVLDNYFRSTVQGFNAFVHYLPLLSLPAMLQEFINRLHSGQEINFEILTLTPSGLRQKKQRTGLARNYKDTNKYGLLYGFLCRP